LVVDHVFAECHLVVCRNVLIYFNKDLQERVFGLFADSLRYGGFLALGSKETLRFSRAATAFEAVDDKWRVYRKITDASNKKYDRRAR
jgi:chemotaxis protein methyltransferase CheR